MKKQILFLALLTLALIFAGTFSSSGQVYKNTDTKVWAAPTCAGSAFYPTAGEPYHYIVDIDKVYGYDGTGTYEWRITTGTDLLKASGTFLTPGTEFTWTGNSSRDVTITWLPASIGKIYYLVIEYHQSVSAAVAGSCDINNIKAYAISPRNGFWLDINASTTAAASGVVAAAATQATGFEVCAPNVSSATITTPATSSDVNVARVEYKFGTTILYAVIHAQGYEGNFNGTLKVSGLAENQSATVTGTQTWTYGGNLATDWGNGSYTATLPSTTLGTDIPVTITITNNQYESRADQPIKISIDGSYSDGTNTYNDLSDAGGNCTPEANDADYVTHTITARPTITPNAPTPFVTPNPALRP